MFVSRSAIIAISLLCANTFAINLSSSVDIADAEVPRLISMMGRQPPDLLSAFGDPSRIFDACDDEPGCVAFDYNSFRVFYYAEGAFKIHIFSKKVSLAGVSVGDAIEAAKNAWGVKEIESFSSGNKFVSVRKGNLWYIAALDGDGRKVERLQIESAPVVLDQSTINKTIALLDESGARVLSTLGYPTKIVDICKGSDSHCVDFDYGSFDVFVDQNKVYKVSFWSKSVDFFGVSQGMSLKDAQKQWGTTDVKSFSSGRKYISRREGVVNYVARLDEDGAYVKSLQVELAN